jgi:transposase InsO family protein
LHPPVEPGQYRAIRYTERLAEAEAVASVGSRGDSYDHAMAEALTRCSRPRHPQPGDEAQGRLEVRDRRRDRLSGEYVDSSNHRMLHGEIGLVPPAESETNHWASLMPEHYPETHVPTGTGYK